MNQGGTADKYLFVLDRWYISVEDVFVFDGRQKAKGVTHYDVNETLVAR